MLNVSLHVLRFVCVSPLLVLTHPVWNRQSQIRQPLHTSTTIFNLKPRVHILPLGVIIETELWVWIQPLVEIGSLPYHWMSWPLQTEASSPQPRDSGTLSDLVKHFFFLTQQLDNHFCSIVYMEIFQDVKLNKTDGAVDKCANSADIYWGDTIIQNSSLTKTLFMSVKVFKWKWLDSTSKCTWIILAEERANPITVQNVNTEIC